MSTSLESVSCNLCGSREHAGLYTGMSGRVVKCTRCGLIFVNPRPPSGSENVFYISDYYNLESSKKAFALRTNVHKRILQRIGKHGNPGKLLDIGCGFGHFLKMAKDRGWEVYGIELSEKAGRFARETLNLQIEQKRLRDCGYPDNFFDVVTLINVLDHFSEPMAELQEIYRVLKNGGLVAIRVPNMNFHLWLHRFIAGNGGSCENTGLSRFTPFHLYGFTPRTVKAMLSRAGLDNVRIINARMSAGDPTASLDSVKTFTLELAKLMFFTVAQISYVLSKGAVIIGSSMEIYAFKGPLNRERKLSRSKI